MSEFAMTSAYVEGLTAADVAAVHLSRCAVHLSIF